MNELIRRLCAFLETVEPDHKFRRLCGIAGRALIDELYRLDRENGELREQLAAQQPGEAP